MTFTLRLATSDDMPALRPLMDRAIRALLSPYLPPEAVEASFEVMGLDTQLIADRTYFAVEDQGRIIGCGGWSHYRPRRPKASPFRCCAWKSRSAPKLEPRAAPVHE
jgi:hypothetical protein